MAICTALRAPRLHAGTRAVAPYCASRKPTIRSTPTPPPPRATALARHTHGSAARHFTEPRATHALSVFPKRPTRACAMTVQTAPPRARRTAPVCRRVTARRHTRTHPPHRPPSSPPPFSPPSPPPPPLFGTTTIVLVSVGGLVVLVLLVGLACFCRRRQRHARLEMQTRLLGNAPISGTAVHDPMNAQPVVATQQPTAT
jgi:hypothetical protein